MKLHVVVLSIVALLWTGASSPQSRDSVGMPAQKLAADHGLPGEKPGTEQWLVQFKRRSFDLSRFRRATLADRPWVEVAPILTTYRAQTIVDQAPFKAAIEKLGGRVYIQYWIVNAAAIEIPHGKVGDVRKLPNVVRVDPNLPAMPAIKVATGAANHNSDAVNSLGFKGKGIATAIVDTGLDAQCGNKNRPHQTFFEDGDLTKRNRLLANIQVGRLSAENTHNHGTGVAGIVAGGNWGTSAADHGHAPHADIVGYSLSHTASGSTDHATQALAWQWVARDATKYNIKTSNCSYHGSPDPLNVSQQALDAAAWNADVMIVVAAGNTGSRTSSSISCANGLAVAAVSPGTHAVASFSSRGPMFGDTQRFYPDIAACGVGTIMPKSDTTTSNYVGSGTSMASPQVCGAATLLRAQVPSLRADETKAILLASALDISQKNPSSPYNTRNAYGLGLVKDNAAMILALDSAAHGRATVTTASNTWQKTVLVKKGRTYRAVAVWMRQIVSSKAWSNLDIEILSGTTIVASSTTPRNLYEGAFFRATADLALTFRVTGVTIELGKQEFAWVFTEGSGPPVSSEYGVFGSGCNSGPLGCSACRDTNWTQQPAAKTTTAKKIGIIAWHPNLNICGVDLYMSARGTAVDVTVSIQEFAASNLPGKVLSTGKVRVGTTAGIYHAKLTPTVPTGGNGVFYITFDHADQLNLPVSPSGIVQAHVEFGTSWGMIQANTFWQHRLHCDRGRQPPALNANGKPILGKSFDVTLENAPGSAAAMFLIGLSNTKWGTVPLPLTYAPMCQLLVAPDFAAAMSTSALGTVSVRLAVPNRQDLIGIVFFNQFLVANNVNSIGVISSNGGRGKIGEF